MRQVRTRPTFSERTSQPARFENLQVLHHRRQRHGQRLGQLTHRGGAAAQPFDHPTTCRVGQGMKDLVQRSALVKHLPN